MTHTALLNECLLLLSARGILAWKNATGALRDGRDQLVRYGCSGSHDILGVMPGGRAIGVEIKVGRDQVRPNQRAFHAAFAQRGGLSVVAKSVEELEQALALAGERVAA